MPPISTFTPNPSFQPLAGVRILSLALNLPGPAALMRCSQLGAHCVKLEPPAGDPMASYSRPAYDQLHKGIKTLVADLKSEAGQRVLQTESLAADVLLTSFRPSALRKLGIGWEALHRLYPALSQVAIVGSPGDQAEKPGHDLTYLAESGLVPGLELPTTLYADMSGSLMASEAVMQAVLTRKIRGEGVFIEVALSSASAYLALPRQWGLTQPSGPVGGSHAGYGIYPCQDGRVAVAALEPHFAAALCAAAGIAESDVRAMLAPATRRKIGDFFQAQTRAELDTLAVTRDIPLHTMA